jgi:hypothetical protein
MTVNGFRGWIINYFHETWLDLKATPTRIVVIWRVGFPAFLVGLTIGFFVGGYSMAVEFNPLPCPASLSMPHTTCIVYVRQPLTRPQ